MSNSVITKEAFPNYHLAHELVLEIKKDIDRLKDLDALFLIDMMAVLGIQFTQGTDCSTEYMKLCSM